MADLSTRLATDYGRERTLLRHSLGSPPLFRLLIPRLAATAPDLFSPARKLANEISHVLVESADSEGAMEAASLLFSLTESGAAARADLLTLLAARQPTSLMEWHWLYSTVGEGAQTLPINAMYWGVLQVRPGVLGRGTGAAGRRNNQPTNPNPNRIPTKSQPNPTNRIPTAARPPSSTHTALPPPRPPPPRCPPASSPARAPASPGRSWRRRRGRRACWQR
jgi:hypothetical protein